MKSNPNRADRRILRGATRVGEAVVHVGGQLLNPLKDAMKKLEMDNKKYQDAQKKKQQMADNQAQLNKGKSMKGVQYSGKSTSKSPYKSGLN